MTEPTAPPSAPYSYTLTLYPTAPFAFAHTLRRLGLLNTDGDSREVGARGFRKALRVVGTTVVCDVTSRGRVEAPELVITAYADVVFDETLVAALTDRVGFFLGLGDGLEPFYTLAADDPAFEPVVAALYGYHQVKFPTPFQGACWALVTQRTPNRFAALTMRRLAERLGGAVTVDGETYHSFPDPQQLLAAEPGVILEATNNTRKTERLAALTDAFAVSDEDFLRSAPYREVAKWLGDIKGLGAWSVDFIMAQALGRHEQAPWTDTWLLDAVSRVYTGGLSISLGDAKALATFYGAYQGYWAHYLKTAQRFAIAEEKRR
ncbi:MAG: hypothetical protein U5L04_00475 [Trueperaceae bacterium]|nr:hypothetical protein [Trueperaceae bacterium]